jgi:hypothetical protein
MAVHVSGWDTPCGWATGGTHGLKERVLTNHSRVQAGTLVARPHSGLCERAEVVCRPHIQEIPHLPTNRKIPLDPILNDSHPEFSPTERLQWTHGCLTFFVGGILSEEPVRWFFGSVVG